MKICTHCGTEGEGKYRGSFAVTLFLLLFWIIPGVIYDHWRQKGGKCVCKACGKEGLTPLSSPRGQELGKAA